MNTYSPAKHRLVRSQQLGFSILEAIFALVLTMVGLTALLRMQNAQTNASLSAKELSAASNIAEWGVSQLSRDSYGWTGTILPPPYLNQSPQIWHSMTDFPIDHNGMVHRRDDQDRGTTIRRQRYCVQYWIKPLTGLYEGLLNARVRVVWSRNPLDQTAVYNACGEGNSNAFQEDAKRWYTLTVPFVLRRHP